MDTPPASMCCTSSHYVNSPQAESLLATVRAEYSSWVRTQQPLVGSVPQTTPLPLQSSSAETYLGPSYATFQSAVKSSHQQSTQAQVASTSTAGGQVGHADSSLSTSGNNGSLVGSAVEATAAATLPSSSTDPRTGKQQQRSFAAIGFNYNSNASGSGSTSVVTPMPMTMPAALKRPRSPSKREQPNHHRTFQELVSTSAAQDNDGDSSSIAAAASTSTSTACSRDNGTARDAADDSVTGASHTTAKKAFWMA